MKMSTHVPTNPAAALMSLLRFIRRKCFVKGALLVLYLFMLVSIGFPNYLIAEPEVFRATLGEAFLAKVRP